MAPLNDPPISPSNCQCPAEPRACSPYFSLPSAVLLNVYSYDTVPEILKRDLPLNRAVHSLLVDTLHIYDLVLSNENRLIPWPQRPDAIAGPSLLSYGELCSSAREVLSEVADLSAFSCTFYDLITEGIVANSQDDPVQDVSKSVTNDDEFWSSSGKAHMACHGNCSSRRELPTCVCNPEYLVYGLCDRSLITRVEINFYRADYQPGQPIYAPRAVRVFVRDDLEDEWTAVTAFIETQNTSKRLSIHLAPRIVIGTFIKLELYGRQQTQQEDGQWYVCVRYARVVGVPLSSSHFSRRYPILKSLISAGSPNAGSHPEYDRVLMGLEYDIPRDGPWLPSARITSSEEFGIALLMMDRALRNLRLAIACEPLHEWRNQINPVTSVAVYKRLFTAYAELFTSDWSEVERQRVRDGLRVPDPIGVMLRDRYERFRVGDQRLTAFETVMLIRWFARQPDRREAFQGLLSRSTSSEERMAPCLLTVEVGDELRRYDLARSIMVYQHSRVLPHDCFLGTFIRLGIDWPTEESDPVHDLLLNLRGNNAAPLLTRFYGANTRELAHVVSVCIAHYQALVYPVAASVGSLGKPMAESGPSGKRYAERIADLIDRLPLNPHDESALRIQLLLRLEDTGSHPELAVPSRYPGCPTLIALDDVIRKFGDFDEE
ncbi:hypothetical protein FOZ62_018909 [Perkinsus olseni]|uniref:Uncharacterized protein n=1 Tax=Perkinsus olseni TaxID=32597 RepID=A0A7J6Q7L2_PEROL|nr:hypothetical protein FOZ62_018909 [Perkinsus olseni]